MNAPKAVSHQLDRCRLDIARAGVPAEARIRLEKTADIRIQNYIRCSPAIRILRLIKLMHTRLNQCLSPNLPIHRTHEGWRHLWKMKGYKSLNRESDFSMVQIIIRNEDEG